MKYCKFNRALASKWLAMPYVVNYLSRSSIVSLVLPVYLYSARGFKWSIFSSCSISLQHYYPYSMHSAKRCILLSNTAQVNDVLAVDSPKMRSWEIANRKLSNPFCQSSWFWLKIAKFLYKSRLRTYHSCRSPHSEPGRGSSALLARFKYSRASSSLSSRIIWIAKCIEISDIVSVSRHILTSVVSYCATRSYRLNCKFWMAFFCSPNS